MIGIPVGIVYADLAEWGLHKWLLHKAPQKNKDHFFKFHFYEHHKESRVNAFQDPMYRGNPFQWNAAGKELAALAVTVVIHLPFTPIAPFFVGTVAAKAANYYRVHRKSHLDPEWAREHLPWHYDHHMGPDQECNWGVTHDWTDRLLGTRKEWVGTEGELKQRGKLERLREKRKELRQAA